VLRWRWAGQNHDVALLVVLQATIQYFFFLLLKLFYFDFNFGLMLFAYGVTFLLQTIYWLFDRTQRFRLLSTVVMCNSYLLFFSGPKRYMLLVIVMAWVSRTFIRRDSTRNAFNAGTFGIFWGAIVSTYIIRGGLNSVSHGLNTIPHLPMIVVLLGTGMAWLGGYLAIPMAMLLSFTTLRGAPNPAEMVVFLIAAPDPLSTPPRMWGRWVFGTLAGGLTAISWHVLPLGNELLKIGGLVMTGFILLILRKVDWDQVARRVFGQWADEARWNRPALRGIAVAGLVIYAVSIDHVRPARTMEMGVSLRDGRSGTVLTSPPDIPAWPSHSFSMTVDGNPCVVQWEELFRGWDNRCQRENAPAPTATNISLRVPTACHPEGVDGAPYLRVTEIAESARARTGMSDLREYQIRVALDQEALRNACTNH
jgi:hypothetical protein